MNNWTTYNNWFYVWVLSLCIPLQSHAISIPLGWNQYFDERKQAQVFRPADKTTDLLIKYYPKSLLERQDISRWLNNKLSQSKAPRGEWLGRGQVVRDNANYAHGGRKFRQADGTTGSLVAIAVTADRLYARLAVMIYTENKVRKSLRDQALPILKNIFEIEKADALEEGRGTDIEASPPKIKGITQGGPIKAGRYVGTKTRRQKVLGRYEVMLYDTGEYEFLRGESKSGNYTYSQSTGRLNMSGDFYNSTHYPREDYCVYGADQKTGIPVIYARDDNIRYRLNWVNPTDRLSPRQNK